MAPIKQPLREMALFAGAGGGILGGILLGWETICAVEINAFCARRLMQRQNEGHLPPFPVWDDVSTFDGYPWRGRVDVVSGGFPCQDISQAGGVHKASAGLDGERSGLWREMSRVVREVEPRFVLVENSPALSFRGLGTVLRDLAEMGYNAKWGVFSAVECGAHHVRERIWIAANASGERMERQGDVKHPNENRPWGAYGAAYLQSLETFGQHEGCGESPLLRVDDGMADWMDSIKAIGNGQVPAVVKLAWETLAH